MQHPQTTQQFIDKIDAILDATESAGRYDTFLLGDYDGWYSTALSRRGRRINLTKRLVGCVTIFISVFMLTGTLIAQPDYKTHYANQPCDVNASVQNLRNLLSQ